MDYLITWRDEFVGRMSLTPCRRAGANRRCFASPKSPSSLRLLIPLRPHEVDDPACVRRPHRLTSRVTDLVYQTRPMACSNAHAMPRRHCTLPGFNLARAQAHVLARSLPLGSPDCAWTTITRQARPATVAAIRRHIINQRLSVEKLVIPMQLRLLLGRSPKPSRSSRQRCGASPRMATITLPTKAAAGVLQPLRRCYR